jgi:hypothetical protein
VTDQLDWIRPRYEAVVWWCGDDYCDCYRPQIMLRTPNLTVGPPWDRLTSIWEGTFTSGPSGEEYRALKDELAAECELRAIPEGNSYAEDQPPDIALQVDREQMKSVQ